MRPLTSRRRDSNEIAYSIIRSAYEGERKTRIMYRAGLNLHQLNGYLALLMEKGMAELGPDKRYRATEKGKKFITAFERYSQTRQILSEQSLVLSDFWSASPKKAAVLESSLSLGK